MKLEPLVTHVQPLGGGVPSFYQASAQASDIDSGVSGEGAAQFRARLAKSVVAVRRSFGPFHRTAEGVGQVRFPPDRGGNPTRAGGHQRSAASAAPPKPLPAPTAPAAPAGASAGASADAGVDLLVARLQTLLALPATETAGADVLAPEDQRVVNYFSLQDKNFEMSPLVTTALTVLRNESNTEDWLTLSQHLNALVRKSFTLGILADRELLDQLQFHGDIIEEGGHPTAVLRVFSEMLPNKRHVAGDHLSGPRKTPRRQEAPQRVNRSVRSSARISWSVPFSRHHAARVAASSTAPQPRGRGSSVRGGGGRYSSAGASVSLPFTLSTLPPAATGRRAAHQGGSTRGNGRGASAPPPPPTEKVHGQTPGEPAGHELFAQRRLLPQLRR
ncbi:unnamed protein product [Pylaiella littoralis]